MGKDLLKDGYGRYFEIPEHLATRGHEVAGLTISYRHSLTPESPLGLARWESINAIPFPPISLKYFFEKAKILIHEMEPDIIWAGSDVIHCILASRLSSKYRIPLIIDLYDNYESYRLTSAPMLKGLFVSSCQKADAITTIGKKLQRYVETSYEIQPRKIFSLHNAISSELFKPLEKTQSRNKLGLPASAKLIGTAGSLTKDRGIDVVFLAFIQLAEAFNDIYLVLAGQRDRTVTQYKHDRIIDLGALPLDQVPLVFNSLDVAIISNKASAFGEYCFPQKFYEIVSCQTPLVATNVGEMSTMLEEYPSMLFSEDSVEELKCAVLSQLNRPQSIPIEKNNSWSDRAASLEKIMLSITQ